MLYFLKFKQCRILLYDILTVIFILFSILLLPSSTALQIQFYIFIISYFAVMMIDGLVTSPFASLLCTFGCPFLLVRLI